MDAMKPTDEEMSHFRAFCEAKETPFNACPPEIRTKMNRVSVPGNTVSPTMEEVKSRYATLWDEADANKDGYLNEAEWLVYSKLMLEVARELYGWAPDWDEAYEAAMKQGYQAMTSFTPHDEKGVGQGDPAMTAYMKVVYTVRREYEAAGKWIPGYETFSEEHGE